jgi:hypothetical protein
LGCIIDESSKRMGAARFGHRTPGTVPGLPHPNPHGRHTEAQMTKRKSRERDGKNSHQPLGVVVADTEDNCPGDDDALEKRVLAALERANGLHPLAERLVSALLRIDMPLRLAEFARVPEEKRGEFWLAVFGAVLDAWEHDASGKMAVALKQNEALSRAIDALKAARQALADLDEECERVGPSGRGGLGESQFWWGLPKVTAEIEQGVDRFFAWVQEETEPNRRRADQRGRPLGTVTHPRFRVFLRELRHTAKTHGGRLGLQKNAKKGALLDAIKLLAPHLPDGFVPKRLSASTLQRIIKGG